MQDEQIVALVYQELASTGYRQFNDLRAYCHSGRVTIQGDLPTYFLKQVAQKAVSKVNGVQEIDNDVKVPRRRLEARTASW